MTRVRPCTPGLSCSCSARLARGMISVAAEADWICLIGDHELAAWREPTGAWLVAGDARLDPKDPKRLAAVAGAR